MYSGVLLINSVKSRVIATLTDKKPFCKIKKDSQPGPMSLVLCQ